MKRSGVDPSWRRIAGLETSESGAFAMVWLAHDLATDVVHVYDACLWASEVMSVILDGVGARGRFVPVAWTKRSEAVVRQLLDRGIDTLPEPVPDDPASRELASREVLGRIRSKRLRADKRLAEWLREYRTYFAGKDGTPPRDTHPLMAATQHAVMEIDQARAPEVAWPKKARQPVLAIV